MSEKHKVFFSFYHQDDQKYKDNLCRVFANQFIDKSVGDGDIDPDDSTEYVKRLIREDFISDSSVVVVLVGNNTRTRKHVDWEIYAGLRDSVNGRSGLIGVMLPYLSHITRANMEQYLPDRLMDNVRKTYSAVYTWEEFTTQFTVIVDRAYSNRITRANLADNSRPQRLRNG